jgi:hypothetical protein
MAYSRLQAIPAARVTTLRGLPQPTITDTFFSTPTWRRIPATGLRRTRLLGPTSSGLGVAPATAVGAAAGSVIPGIGTAVGSVIGTIAGGLFKTSAAGPNATAAKAVWAEVQKGNLAAVAAFISRNGIQTQ